MRHFNRLLKTLLVITLVSSFSANAQNSFSTGLRAGANFANITNTEFTTRTDFYMGVVGELKLGKIYALQPEFGYSRQGARGDVYRNREPKELVATEIQADYITLGAMNKFNFNEYFGLMIGPSLEQQLTQNRVLRRSWDMAVSFGFEVKTPFGLGFEARVKRGLWDIINSTRYETLNSSKGWLFFDENVHLVMQAGLVYHFNSKK